MVALWTAGLPSPSWVGFFNLAWMGAHVHSPACWLWHAWGGTPLIIDEETLRKEWWWVETHADYGTKVLNVFTCTSWLKHFGSMTWMWCVTHTYFHQNSVHIVLLKTRILFTWAVVVLILSANCDANGLKPIMVCKYSDSVHQCSFGERTQHAKWLADSRLLFQLSTCLSPSPSVSSARVSCASSQVILFNLMAILIIIKSRWLVKGLTIAWVALCEFHPFWLMCVKCIKCMLFGWQF